MCIIGLNGFIWGACSPLYRWCQKCCSHVMSKTAQLVVAPWEFGSDEASSPSTATSGRSRKRAAKPHASMSIFYNQYPNIVAKHSHLPQACCIKRINPPLHSDSHVWPVYKTSEILALLSLHLNFTITMFLVTFLSTVVQILYIFVWDFVLALINIVTFNRRKGRVTPRGTPGAEGKWPAYIAPKAGDSRSACPALNALANHGKSNGHYYLNLIVCAIFFCFWQESSHMTVETSGLTNFRARSTLPSIPRQASACLWPTSL